MVPSGSVMAPSAEVMRVYVNACNRSNKLTGGKSRASTRRMGKTTSVIIHPAGPSSIFPILDHAAGRVPPNRVFCIGCQLLGEISLTLPGLKIQVINPKESYQPTG